MTYCKDKSEELCMLTPMTEWMLGFRVRFPMKAWIPVCVFHQCHPTQYH